MERSRVGLVEPHGQARGPLHDAPCGANIPPTGPLKYSRPRQGGDGGVDGETCRNVRQVLREAEEALQQAGVVSARAEAEWLVAEACGLSRTELFLADSLPEPEILRRIDHWVLSRLTGEPLQHLIGYTDFCGHRLEVSRDVLIPRPETEALVDEARNYLEALTRRGIAPRVLDLGTGSGNIATSLSLAIPSCVVVAVELSWNALRTARANLRRHQLGSRVLLIQADWTQGLLRKPAFDLVISNPPYVPTSHVHGLPREVGYEPRLSLDGGCDGMAFHRRLIADAPALLRRDGVLCMECAESQAEVLCQLASRQSWVREVAIVNDLAGRPRGLWVAS
ncbi:MAG TPA: peptide chain release factor N(5)-glutamine methyltransferase [Candidatus Omnitrophica bacterium]|nr:peptide chain release factor N(5)-glutamine methyltransferase [Candidatus Omnitrophota bacterium]